jgi:hypothetical protein
MYRFPDDAGPTKNQNPSSERLLATLTAPPFSPGRPGGAHDREREATQPFGITLFFHGILNSGGS